MPDLLETGGWMMARRLVTGALAGMLVFATALLVMLALRPDAPPKAPTAPLDIGAVEAVGDTTWRWIGPNDCTPDTDIIQIQRKVGDGEWVGSRIPLVNVFGISFSQNGEDGVAFGTSNSCVRQIAVTRDGGRSWRTDSRNPVLIDAWWVEQRIWGIDNTSGMTTLGAFRFVERRGARLKAEEPVNNELPEDPVCDAQDGTPTRLAFYTESSGLLLCEQRIINERLIARTTNTGKNFERLTDSRASTGLDGLGTIDDFEVAGTEDVWVLFSPGGECPEGQLRNSDSQGAIFIRLPCLARGSGVDEIYSVAFTDPRHGVMLAVGKNQPMMLTTDNGGNDWTVDPS